MATVLKVKCIDKRVNNDWQGQREFRFTPVMPKHGDTADENSKFFAATPYGEFKFGCVNELVDFEIGKEYYVNISPVA